MPDDATLDITGQTAQVLATIDRLLAEAGTDKTKILMAQIYVANMKEFDGMNKAWDAWVAAGNSLPARHRRGPSGQSRLQGRDRRDRRRCLIADRFGQQQ